MGSAADKVLLIVSGPASDMSQPIRFSLIWSLKRISLAADIFQQHTRVQYLLDLSVTVLVPDVSHIKGITDDLLMFHSSSARDWTEGSVGL